MEDNASQPPSEKRPRGRRRWLIALGALVVICLCAAVAMSLSGGQLGQEEQASRESQPVEVVEQEAPAVEISSPTDTPQPTVPQETPAPTATPEPTATLIPSPTDTPRPLPTPVVLQGSGDAVVDLAKGAEPALVQIQGNQGAGFFAVTSLDANNNRQDLLVNTTEPYRGMRPLDFLDGQQTARFEVQADGPWSLTVVPLSAIEVVRIPGQVSGEGDYVFAIDGGTPDTARITGNAGADYFGVFGYARSKDVLVNTTDPYEGTVLLDGMTAILEVRATGAWTIEVTTR